MNGMQPKVRKAVLESFTTGTSVCKCEAGGWVALIYSFCAAGDK
jgi:hypothetical protein